MDGGALLFQVIFYMDYQSITRSSFNHRAGKPIIEQIDTFSGAIGRAIARCEAPV